MFPNPYAAQEIARMKISEARRQANQLRLLGSQPRRDRRQGGRTLAWVRFALAIGVGLIAL